MKPLKDCHIDNVTDLDMPTFVFVGQDQHACNVAVECSFTRLQVIIELQKSSSNSIAKDEDRTKRWPVFVFLWYLRVALQCQEVRGDHQDGKENIHDNGQDHQHGDRYPAEKG